jgi:hypothetical protein
MVEMAELTLKEIAEACARIDAAERAAMIKRFEQMLAYLNGEPLPLSDRDKEIFELFGLEVPQ